MSALAYLNEHRPRLEQAFFRCVEQLVAERAADPLARVAELFAQQAAAAAAAAAAAEAAEAPAAAQPNSPSPVPSAAASAATGSGAEPGASGWTLAAWLASTKGVVAGLARAVLGPRRAAAPQQSELDFVRGLGAKYAGDAAGGRAEILALLREGGALDAVAEALWAGIEQLTQARAATGVELQTKFLQEGAGLLTYGGLNTFYGGLGARIGDPNANVDDQMAREHTECGDAHE
jgi:hypothetical protein